MNELMLAGALAGAEMSMRDAGKCSVFWLMGNFDLLEAAQSVLSASVMRVSTFGLTPEKGLEPPPVIICCQYTPL